MAPRPTSWREVAALSPTAGAVRRGRALGMPGGWQGMLQFSRAGGGPGGTGRGNGRGQPNALERAEADKALNDSHDGFNIFNAGGKALIGALDALDTPRAAVVASLYGEGGLLSDDPSLDKIIEDTRRNITFGEATGLNEGQGPGWAKALAGFAGDVALDPLTYVDFGAHRPGIQAGKPAARKFLEEDTQKFLGERLAQLAEKQGKSFADDAERAAFVAEEGKVAGERAAQKSLRFKNNKVLTELEREAIGATPGTYVNLPGTGKIGRTLQIDRVMDAVTGGRFTAGEKGIRAVRLTEKELPFGRLAARGSAKVRESKVGDALAEVFTRYPTLRNKIVHGTPEEAAKSFLTLSARNRGTLQRRLFETTWATKLEDILSRAKKARVDPEDLWYATGEAADAIGPHTLRVEERAPGLVGEAKKFFEDIQTAANEIDPEYPWLASIADYTPRIPSEDVAAARANRFATAGGALRKETFDYKRELVPGRELFDEMLVEPKVHPKGWTVEKQIDDILTRNGVPNWNQTNAFKAFPDYVRRLSTRYGEEVMAKQLRDLGVADVALKRVISEKGVSQGQAKATILKMITRARERARLAEREAVFATQQGERFGRVAQQGELIKEGAEGRLAGARQKLTQTVERAEPQLPAIREWEQYNIEAASKVATDRSDLLGRLQTANEDVLNLSHAEVEASQRVNLETHQAYRHVTELESRISDMYDELGDMYDRLNLLDSERVDYKAAREALDEELPKAQKRVDALKFRGDRNPAEELVLTQSEKYLNELQAAKNDPELFTVWADENFKVGRGTGKLDDSVQQARDMVTQLEGHLAESEELLAQMNEVALRPIEPLQEQLQAIESELQPRLSDRDGLMASGLGASDELMSQIEMLANLKSSVLHEMGVVERAQARVTELTNPETIAQHLDQLRDAEALGNNTIHALFPELPAEVHGSRVREFMNDRMGELQNLIDDTNDQVLSAYTDRDTLRVDLDKISKQKREAERKLKQVRSDIKPQVMAATQLESSLLSQAEAAAKEAIAVQDDLTKLDQEAPGLVHDVLQAEREVDTAQSFVASMHSKRMMFEARATRTEATAAGKRQVARIWEDIGKRNLDKDLETALEFSLRHNWKQLGAVSQVKEAWLLDGLKAATIMSGPESIRPSLRMYDKVLNMWKSYALSTPGTVMRNIFGGVFNNWLAADLKFTDYTSFMAAHKAFGTKAFDKLPEDIRTAYRAVREGGLLTGGGTSLEIERRLATGVSMKPWSPDFFYTRTFRAGQEEAENMLRGTLAMRTMRDGGSLDNAIDQVFKYHFDYDDLSSMERSVFRRVIPFYTWTRKNLPLMLEEMVRQPQKFTRFYQLKNEVELYSPQETIVPSYFTEEMAVRLPFTFGQGQDESRAYMLPDLPFTSLNDVSDPSVALSQVSPFIKTPIEYAFGRQFFKGLPLRDSYQPVPAAMAAPMRVIPGVVPLLEATGKLQKNADGSLAMKQKDLYVLEQFLPVYGKARRLFPSEAQYDNRLATTWLSWAFGLGLRTNTAQDRRNEASRRIRARFEDLSSLEELGYIPEGTKQPRLGQTINAAYEQLGIEKED